MAPLPDFGALRPLAVRPPQLLADAARERFLWLARPCVQRVPETASRFAGIQAVASCDGGGEARARAASTGCPPRGATPRFTDGGSR